MYEKYGQFTDGKWHQSTNGETYEVLNPANEEIIGHASKASPEDVEIEMGNEYTRRLNRDGTAPEASKYAIAVPVFNHESQKVEIFSATQKGIIKEFDKISQMEDYSDLLAWDFVLSREGTGLKTEYSLRAVPRKKGTSPLIEATYAESKDSGFDIKELMTGGNPFSPGE